jgi:hypothetical protein
MVTQGEHKGLSKFGPRKQRNTLHPASLWSVFIVFEMNRGGSLPALYSTGGKPMESSSNRLQQPYPHGIQNLSELTRFPWSSSWSPYILRGMPISWVTRAAYFGELGHLL